MLFEALSFFPVPCGCKGLSALAPHSTGYIECACGVQLAERKSGIWKDRLACRSLFCLITNKFTLSLSVSTANEVSQ